MSRFSFKSFGLSVLAVALAFAFTPSALAAEFNGQVKVVPNPNAAPVITAKVDPAKLAALKLHELPEGAKDLGRMDGNQTLTLELRLARTHVAQSATLALRRQVQDPTSPWYGKTLTPAEFAENFGLAGSDLDTLTTWLKAQGFEVGTVDNGRMVIGFSGTVAQVDEAFHTEMHNYAAKDGSPRFAPAMAPQIPYAFRAVVGHVAGIENFRENRAATFPGPVKDFISGTTNASLAETSGTSTPNPHGELLHDSSFTISSPAIGIGGHAKLNVRLGGNTHAATGSLTLVNESTGDTVAHIADITACTGYNGGYGRSCTVDFAPAGAGTDFLKAIYSGDEHERGTVIGYNIISHVGTQANYSTVTISSAVSTYMWYSGAGNTTFASNIYYAGAAGTAASAATGTYSLDYYDYDSVETVIVNAANLTTCTTTTSTHNVSCSNAVSGSTLNTDSASQGYNQMDLVYSGDTNYASTSAAIFGYDGSGSSATLPTSIALNGSFTTTHTYGASASDSGLTGYTIVSPASPDAGYSTCQSIGELVGTAPVGELSAFLNGGSRTATSYTISFTEPGVAAIPAQLTPGTYPISTIYSGDKDTTFSSTYCTYGPLASTATVTLTEAKQTPTAAMTSPTAAAPTSQLAGSLSAFTVTGTLAWTGTGITPTPGNVSFTSTAAGSFGTITCTAANSSTTFPTSPYTCSATFTPTGTDSAGSYNINLSFATDTNYAAAASTVTSNYNITSPVTPTLALTPATVTSAYAATTPTPAITSTITGQSSNGSSAGIVVTVTANATYGSLSTTNGASSGSSSVTCTTATTTSPNSACVVYFVPNGTTAVGTYSGVFSATSAASSNGLYNAVTTPVTSSLQITQQTPTVAVTSVAPNTEVYGSATTSTVTATLAWVGAAAIPTGSTLSFTSSAGGTFTGESCSGSSSPITCTATFTPTATDAVGSYYIEATYAGDTNYATANSGTTSNYTITKQTPTFGTMSFSPAATEPYGTSQIITISDTLTYTGSGNAPTGAVKYVLNAVSYTATCSAAPSPLTCTVNVPAATIAALPVNTYTVTATYTTDTNYAAATGTSGTFTITGATSTLALTPNPVSSVYGSVTGIVITATATGSAGTPTGTVTFSGAYATYGTLSATTCTLASGACTVTFTPNGTTAVGTGYSFLSASVAANGNYLASNTATDTLNITIASPTLTFSPSPIVSLSGSVTGISVTVTASPAVPGTVAFTGTYATYGTLSATSCTLASGSCSVTFTPNGTTAVGTYSNILTGTLPSNSNYNTATASDSLVIAASGQYAALAVTTTPIAYFDAVGSGSFTAVLSWINPALTPSGTITFTDTTASRTFGAITLSPTGAAIASTACTTVGSIGTCTYTCSAMVDLAVSCTLTNTKASGTNTTTSVADTADGNAVTASYSGNSFFSTATGNAYLYNQYEYTAAGGAATIALSGTPIANATYGLTTAESPTVSITGASSDPPSDSTFPFLDITSTGQTGTMYEINLQTCTTNPCVTATSWTFPAVVAPGTYSLGYNYSGNYQSASGETDQTTLASGSVVVSKQTPTMGTVTFSPAATEPYGASQAITISGTLTYLGIGEAPQGAVTFTSASIPGSPFTATCGAATSTGSGNTKSNVETCTATIPAATIAALPIAAYTVSAAYTTDTNYAAATGTSATFTIAKATVTPAMTSVTPTNQIYGSATALSVAGTISWTGSGAAPTVGDISFTSTDAGSFTGLSCTGSSSPYSCTATFTPTGTDVIGYQAINISFSGDTNYSAAATTIPGTAGTLGTTYNFLINRQTMTFGAGSVTPNSVVFATSTAVALSQVVNYTGSGNQPGTSGFNFTLNGVTYTPSCTTAVSDSFTCTYTVAGSVIAALPVGSYPVTFNFPTAGNYNTATQSVDTLTITGATPTTATISAVSAPFGSTTAVNITVNESGSAGVVTGGVVTFSVNSPATGSFNHSTCTLNSSGNCTVQETFTPTGTLAVGVYSSIQASFGAVGNYAAATATNTETITTATETLSMVAGTPGSTSAGVTSTTLTATLSVPASGATVTFTDVTTAATIGTATTNSSGVATITVNTAGNGSGQSSKPSAGIDKFSAAAAATSNSAAASTTSQTTTYFQGILFSFVGNHNFSGGLTGANDPYSCCAEVEGTVDGTTAAAYGVSVVNFTSASQTLPITLTNAASAAFSLSNQCGSTLSAGEVCTLVFDYAPPNGDGCTPVAYPGPPTGNQCTFDGANYPQGTYETATWAYTLPSGVLAGLGNQGFTTSGVAAASGTLAGKALLEPLNLSVSPTTAAFGTVAQNATSQTITIVVTNNNNSSVTYTYTVPSSGHFSATNTCASPLAANSSCNIYLTMVTSTVGSFTDSLTLTPTGGTPAVVSISGTVAAVSSGITLSSNNHNFGSVTDGTSVDFSITLTNNTGSTATLGFSNAPGAGYSISTNCGTTLAASATCTYGFTFAPTTAGAANDTLTITSSVPILPGGTGNGPYTGTVTVSGTGVAGGNLTATSVTHNWGNISVGTSGGNYGVELTNSTSSTVTLSFSGLTGGSSGFAVVGSSCGASLAVNANCEMIFSFTPTATGFVSGTYPITSSSPLYFNGSAVSPSQITLEGTGQ